MRGKPTQWTRGKTPIRHCEKSAGQRGNPSRLTTKSLFIPAPLSFTDMIWHAVLIDLLAAGVRGLALNRRHIKFWADSSLLLLENRILLDAKV